ncbi:MAG: iron-sulfur cluster assembly scaffold protein [Planctomycetia bacterium]|nr:iron-sulfur cluster assembly scaffold protein [Planctomycetia bacterium]
MASAEDDVYQEHVLDHYESPYHRGRCGGATHAHEDDNPMCGDRVHVDLRIENGRVREAWFDGEGCCISQAAASMLMQKIEGQSVDDVRRFSAEEMLRLFGPRLTPNRQKCCLLGWCVVQAALFSPRGGNGASERAADARPSGDDSAKGDST